MENVKNIGEFVEAVNKNEELRKALNEAVTKALPEKYFESLDAFVSFLPKTIKNFFDEKKLENLGEDWKNFEIQNGDLNKLYEINLKPETKTAIIKKFNVYILNKSDVRLKNKKDVKRAFDTFKKILGQDKASVSDFYDFVANNIGYEVLSSADLDNIVEYVKPVDNEDKFQEWKFWLICDKFKEEPSENFINFIVENTDFDKLDDKYLIGNIVILTRKYPKDKKDKKKDNTEDNTLEALENILGGNDPYKKFSEALANVKDIETKLKLDNIEKIDDNDIKEFASKLKSYNIEITLKDGGFAVKTKETIEKEKPKEVPRVIEGNEIETNNKKNQTEVSWWKIGFGTVLMLLGIVMFASLFLAPGIVLPFLTNLLPISTFTAKITLAVIGFVLAVVGGILSVPGIINNTMYKNNPGGGPGGSQTIPVTLTKKSFNSIIKIKQLDKSKDSDHNRNQNVNKNEHESTI